MMYDIVLKTDGKTVRSTSINATTESDLYQEVGTLLLNTPCPATLQIMEQKGSGAAEYNIRKRDEFIRDGVSIPSIYVTETYNTIYLEPSRYEEVYLTCVNPESNNYKFYHLMPVQGSDGKTIRLGAKYGRIGSSRGEAFGVKELKDPYPPHLFWIRYYEKLSKGYIDQTDVFLGRTEHSESVSETKSADVTKDKNPSAMDTKATTSWTRQLWNRLVTFARDAVRKNVIAESVTPGQVATAKKRYAALQQETTLDGFNKSLLALLSVSPRKARYVSELLAESEADFGRILEREGDLLKAMDSVSRNVTDDETDPVKEAGIDIRPATMKERKQIATYIPSEFRHRVTNVWVISDAPAKMRFEAYLSKTGINCTIPVWHGSRNGNWASILTTRLRHDAEAPRTGNMLGGSRPTFYFAPFDEEGFWKSYGYTSGTGAYWTNGSDRTAIMGIYRIAYKPKLIVAGEYIRHFTNRELGRCNCVRAQKGAIMHHGSHLRHDEIGVFEEDAVLLEFLVELEQ